MVTLSLTAVAATGAAADGEDGPFGNFLTKVADKLGISEEQLEMAIQDARLETIDEALAEGRITEEQAAKMRERVQEGASLFPKRPHHRPGAGVIVDSAAQVLDMEKAGLVEQLKDGSNVRQLTDNAELDRCPHWSPDGKLIVFYSDRNGDREIYVMNADGSGVRQVTDAPGNDEVPNWLVEP